MVKILDPQSAVGNAGRRLEKLGMRFVSGNRETKYYTGTNSNFKIRVSTHADPFKNDDVLVDVVFNYDTIENDVAVQTSNAVSRYDKSVRLKWHIKKGIK